jgi:hypothetical protein
MGVEMENVIFKEFYGVKSVIMGFFTNSWDFKGLLKIYN